METKSFEERMDALGRKADAGVRDWVRNDSVFNWLRNTPARILLALVSVGVLYGIPAAQLFTRNMSQWTYIGALLVVIVLQKLSVRFAFDDDSEIDEYQMKRRNRAYRRAYKRIGLIIGAALALVAWQGIYLKASLGSGFQYSFDLASANWNFAFIFVIGLFALQKYLSWGIKGEPMRDSATKH
ncbi:MAG: hypothetical protein RL672_279 [Actinomycetota bacterium]|jgi:hypothetical protein